jgi:hypothetical protein
MRDAGWSAPPPDDRRCINGDKNTWDDAIAAPPRHTDLGVGATGRCRTVFVTGTDTNESFLQRMLIRC